MYMFMHVFVPLLFVEILIYLKYIKREHIYFFWAIIGALLPDIIDKPLSLLFSTIFSGRGIAHAPLLWIFILTVLFFLQLNRSILFSVGFGVGCHILLDIPYIPIFWPFRKYELLHSSLEDWWVVLITNPLIYISEIMSLLGIMVILKVEKVVFHKKWI
ncbi:MAG: metal-dependent hydrolase [Promethearchaeota archaeon]|nr:MAG: metal-dependent hydrolase [Candidatus Lokiarchaeota archaeon]